MKESSEVIEAKDLLSRTREALKVFTLFPQMKYKETEITFRFNSIEGMLLMCQNDIQDMVKQWIEGNLQEEQK